MSRPFRTITKLDGTQVRLMDLVEGERFHMAEADGQDLGWWTATGNPFLRNGHPTIEARPDIEPEGMQE